MKAIAAPLLALVLLTPGAEAQAHSLSGICGFDIEQYCKHIRKTRIRELKECLAKHEKDLYPRCHDNYRDAR